MIKVVAGWFLASPFSCLVEGSLTSHGSPTWVVIPMIPLLKNANLIRVAPILFDIKL